MPRTIALLLAAALTLSGSLPAFAAGDQARPLGTLPAAVLGAELPPSPTTALPATSLPIGAAALPGAADASSAAAAQPARAAEAVQPAESSEAATESGMRRFDGSGPRDVDGAAMPAVSPALEPPAHDFSPAWDAHEDEEALGRNSKKQELSFPIWEKEKLLSPDPSQVIYKAVKRIADRPPKKNPATGKVENLSKYWYEHVMVKGAEINVVSQGESVFGRPLKISRAVTKRLGELTRDDLKGVVSAYQLKAGVRAIREKLRAGFEKMRQIYTPGDAPVTLQTRVRLIEFPSFIDQYREKHGWKSETPRPAPVERAPVKLKAEGGLSPLRALLPRVVYVDVDQLEGPVSREVLTDMAKLMRVNTHFVFISRKPYAAPGGIKEKIVAPMSYYHIVMLGARALAVSDDGAVISGFGKNGEVEPVDTAEFSDSQMSVLRMAAQRASEQNGVVPGAVKELLQPQLVEEKEGGFPGAPRRERAARKPPQVRFQVALPKGVHADIWAKSFRAVLDVYHLPALVRVGGEDGQTVVTVQLTDLDGAQGRLLAALGEHGNLFLNHPDVVLGAPGSAKTGGLDMAALSGLRGNELLENAVGLMLRDHRVDRPGDLRGSASQLSSFMHHRDRFRQELLVRPDEKGSIFTFAGHVIHGNNDWLVWNLQNGRKVTLEEYKARFDQQWEKGTRQIDPITLPGSDKMDRAKAEFLIKASSMFRLINKIHDRGEILVGTEVPNFFYMQDYKRRTGEARGRFLLRTVFDFIALRPDPNRPGHATLVIYDFKTGRTETRETDRKRKYKKSQHLQMLLYAYFAHQQWVGRPFPAPYLTGDKTYIIDDVKAELIFNSVMLPIDIKSEDLDGLPDLVIRTMKRKNKEEQELLDATAKKKAAKAKPAARKSAKSAKSGK